MDERDEGAILAQIAAGSREAFDLLYRRYERRVYGYLLSLVRMPAIAEELMCETMFEMWRGAARFRGDSKVSTWLLGIARYKALSALRNRHMSSDVVNDEAPDIEAPEDGPLKKVQQKDEAELVQKALQTLSVEHREVLELAFYYDLPYQEIAELVGCPINTVKTRTFYAKQQLKRRLAQLGVMGERDEGA
ncbi:MAG: sigma-70 family RNA polymerase sigma factor [Candidatus Methylomirabilis oxyfera]|nr:sigma-70 family RNA polymerase sigma factor [Candidatus Methylomirabilis oxyfera]